MRTNKSIKKVLGIKNKKSTLNSIDLEEYAIRRLFGIPFDLNMKKDL